MAEWLWTRPPRRRRRLKFGETCPTNIRLFHFHSRWSATAWTRAFEELSLDTRWPVAPRGSRIDSFSPCSDTRWTNSIEGVSRSQNKYSGDRIGNKLDIADHKRSAIRADPPILTASTFPKNKTCMKSADPSRHYLSLSVERPRTNKITVFFV